MLKRSSKLALAFALLLAAQAPALAQSWRAANFPSPNGGWLVYRTIGGNPACASYNARDCLWGVSENQIDFSRVHPLVCGADHRDKWGVTGYENPRHWCNLARGRPID